MLTGSKDTRLVELVVTVLSRVYSSGPFRELTADQAAEEVARILHVDR